MLERIGSYPNSGWDVYSLAVHDPDDLPDAFPVSSEKFVCLLAWNAAHASPQTIAAVAEKLLRAGCVCFCCWGRDCERVHDIIDEVAAGNGASNNAWPNILITWHAKITLREAVAFLLDFARPNAIYLHQCSAAVAIDIGREFEAGFLEFALIHKFIQPPVE